MGLRTILGFKGSGQAPRPNAASSARVDRKRTLPGWSAGYFQKLPDVRTVIDIGVLNGTPSLYEGFPNAYLVLIEALPAYEDACRNIVAKRNGEVHICAAGKEDTSTTLNFIPTHPAISSLFGHRLGGRAAEAQPIEVQVRKLDTLFAGRSFYRNVLLKIDTEGAELDIIRGASETLKSVKYCITETSIAHRHDRSYRMVELMAEMDRQGFDVLDILTVTRSEAGSPGANIADVLFVNRSL